MSKIKVTATHDKREIYHYVGEVIDNKITYKNDQEYITVTLEEVVKINKKVEENTVNLVFNSNDTTECTYETPFLGSVILHVETKNLEIENNRIYVEYNILESNELHTYEIEYEVI